MMSESKRKEHKYKGRNVSFFLYPLLCLPQKTTSKTATNCMCDSRLKHTKRKKKCDPTLGNRINSSFYYFVVNQALEHESLAFCILYIVQGGFTHNSFLNCHCGFLSQVQKWILKKGEVQVIHLYFPFSLSPVLALAQRTAVPVFQKMLCGKQTLKCV